MTHSTPKVTIDLAEYQELKDRLAKRNVAPKDIIISKKK